MATVEEIEQAIERLAQAISTAWPLGWRRVDTKNGPGKWIVTPPRANWIFFLPRLILNGEQEHCVIGPGK